MAADTSAIDQALGAIGATFRLVRLYPATHPAVVEAMRQIAATLLPLAALGTLEWKVGATGLHWQGRQILPRNSQVGELAGLLYARGVRAIQLNPGWTPEHVLALFNVATGTVAPDHATLGPLSVLLGQPAQPLSAVPAPGATVPAGGSPRAAAPAEGLGGGPEEGSGILRSDALPADVEARRLVVALRGAASAESQRLVVERLQTLAPDLLALREVAPVAEVVAALDAALPRIQDPDVLERVGAAAGTLADEPTVERMITRLGEPRVPPAEREALVRAVGALGAVAASRVLDVCLAVPADLRDPYRAAIRAAADRAVEPLETRLADRNEAVVAGAAQFLGLTGSPAAVPILLGLIRHRAEPVRESALLALAEIGGRDIARPAIPALKDESVLVRAAAAKAVAAGGDPSATTVLVRRLDQEEDEGVLAELLRAIGRLGAREALEVLARHAEPGSRLARRTPFVRAAAIEGLAYLIGPEARALLELYRQDKDPAVKRAAEEGLR